MVSVKRAQLVALSAAVAALSVAAAAGPRVDPGVHRALRRQGTVNVIVTLKESNKATIDSVHEASYPSRGAKIEALVTKLKQHAESTQTDINKVIAKESGGAAPLFARAKSLWISNQVSFTDASFALVEKLAALPSISEIREEIVLPAPSVNPLAINITADASATAVKNQWGVTKIQASDVWVAGYDGSGVVVGHIDTGVQYTHEALHGNWRGAAYGWFDPTANKSLPYDDSGHGSHTLGSLAGSHGIGVAPGATWMSCRACTLNGCKETDLLACGQFMTCPTDPAGNNRDCSQAPRVVSNAWGGGHGDAFYDAVINTWQASGIIPIFANGNTGPECNTTNSPADNPNVIAVGMTDRKDGLDYGSSKGPAISGLLKPEISAPGAGIRSAWIGEDNEYASETGTSCATPHVAGVVAILLSAAPFLTYNDVREILLTTTDTASLTATGYTCGGTEDTTFPNNQYGYGRINALKAFNEATGMDATAVPTEPPSVCDDLSFFQCFRNKACAWGESGACELAPPATDPPAGGSGSGGESTEEPTEAPTETPTETPTPEPTTLAPTPEPTTQAPTPAPTTPAPTPASTTPAPTTPAPTPAATIAASTTREAVPCPSTTTPVPRPTTAAPKACKGLSFLDCFRSKGCTWGIFTFQCKSV